MSSGTSPDSSSPRGSSHKVQNGRIEKARGKKETKQPTYRIGGRTFACEACKKGHRVSKCTHASERPVSMTNDPGRPSGDQKRHCDCPKQCACTKKNCKCDRNCSCTQKMYMLVYVPMKDGEKAREGEWQIGQEVITDLQGKKLTDEEIRIRNELKQMQQIAKVGAPNLDPLKLTPSTPIAISPPKSCCQHKKNIEEKKQPIPVPEEVAAGQRRPQCNCGTGCACAFCLDHPNNQTSHLLAQQQAAYFSNQSYGQQQMNPSWAPLQGGGSCMGTNPHFAISNTPNPSQSQFQTLFPAAGAASQGGYFISYPFTRFSSFVQPALTHPMHSPSAATPMSALPPTAYMTEIATPTPSLQPSMSSCCNPSTEADFPTQPEDSAIDTFDLSSYDIGNAVASGWNDSDEFAFNPAFGTNLHGFSNDVSWDPGSIDPLPDIGSTTISDAVVIESSLISPSQAGIEFPMTPNIPPSVIQLPSGNCSHQVCCQHGVTHHHGQVSHRSLQTGLGLPVDTVSTPMIHNIYAQSLS